MGSSVRAKCQCGFNKSFSLGGGMDNHLTFCAFPCYCYDCKSLYTDNLYNDKLECDNCHSNKCSPFDEQKFHGLTAKIMQPIITYKQPSFLGKILGHKPQEIIHFISEDNHIFSWNTKSELGREIYLTNDNYFCPQCEKLSLKFQMAGFFD